MHLHPFLYEFRSGFILLGGLCSVFVTHEIKKRIIRVSELWGQKTEIEGLFGQQVSPQVVETLIKNKDKISKSQVSILFLDIRNFSSFIELMDPQEVNDFQNDQDYFFTKFKEIQLKGIEKPIEVYQVSKTTDNSNNGKLKAAYDTNVPTPNFGL
jgi:class 3 adenylate cyclase